MNNPEKINHLFRRAAFGPRFHDPVFSDPGKAVNWLVDDSKHLQPLTLEDWSPVTAQDFKSMDDSERKAFRKTERSVRLKLQDTLLQRYASGTGMLREKMTFFWMGHFACKPINPVFTVGYYNHIHSHAMGSFSELLDAMIRDAALLQYLNNHQNRKGNPNENFARELFELFTLGRGNYTETDIREAARALTGWGFDREGAPRFSPNLHDEGKKTIFGKTGNFKGSDLTEMILSQPACAEFITAKCYRFLVSEQINTDRVKSLSGDFRKSGYDIGALVRQIILSDWFFDDAVAGCKIKSPIELVAGISGDFNIRFEDPMARFAIQRILGQNLFDPPNVSGWPRDRSWIDSSALIYRMKLPEMLLQEAESVFEEKEEYDALEMYSEPGKSGGSKRIKTTYETTAFEHRFNGIHQGETEEFLATYFLAKQAPAETLSLIRKNCGEAQGPGRLLKTAIYLMCLPEYQLC